MAEQPKPDIKVQQTPPVTGQGVKERSAFSDDVSRFKNFIQKLREGIAKRREMAQNNPSQVSLKEGLFANNKKLVIILVVFLLLLILLVFAGVYKSMRDKNGAGPKPTTAPVASPSPTPTLILNPSRYATDSAVIELETKIYELDRDLGADIRETNLLPPPLDFNINFNK